MFGLPIFRVASSVENVPYGLHLQAVTPSRIAEVGELGENLLIAPSFDSPRAFPLDLDRRVKLEEEGPAEIGAYGRGVNDRPLQALGGRGHGDGGPFNVLPWAPGVGEGVEGSSDGSLKGSDR